MYENTESKDRFTKFVLIVLVFNLFFMEYLNKQLSLLPRYATWLPEIISILFVVIILVRFAVIKEFVFSNKYLFIIISFIVIFTASSLLNLSGPGSIIVGMRNYFKTLPLFLLPAVFRVDAERLKRWLKLFLPLLLIQCPLALYQRLIQFGLNANSDNVRGSLNTSGVLSFYLICAIAVLNGLYQKKYLSLKQFVILSLILFIPTTINETKVTIVYIPLAIVVPFLLNNEHHISIKFRKLVSLAAVGIILSAIFVTIYDYIIQDKWGHGIFEFVTTGKAVEYVYSGTPYNTNKNWRRGDRLVVAAATVSKDLGTFFFGYGPGNVTGSYFSKFQDKAIDPTARANSQAVNNFIWETGFTGLIVYFTFLFFIFKDAFYLRVQDNLIGAFALGWCGVVVISSLNLFYQNILIMNVINYTFWFFSGVIASHAQRSRQEEMSNGINPLHLKNLNVIQ